MKARLAGFMLWALLLAPAILAFLAMPFVVLFATADDGKAALRAFDTMVSATLVGGSAYMSLSAWSWACKGRWWARAVIWITEQLQPGHCEAAFTQEAPILDAINALKGKNSP